MSRTLLRLGLTMTDFLAKKSGMLDVEEKQEFVENMRGSDVYYLYNKHIEKLTPNEFFEMYFNNQISHISKKNIKQLTLAKRITPTESREYLAETHSLLTRLIAESRVVESAGSAKCFEHPRPDQFKFVLEDTDDNVSIFIQTEDLQYYLEGQESQGIVSNKLAPRVTRRFSTTVESYIGLNPVLTRLQSNLGSDYNAEVKLKSIDKDSDPGVVTYMFSVTGDEAEEFANDLSQYPGWKVFSEQSKTLEDIKTKLEKHIEDNPDEPKYKMFLGLVNKFIKDYGKDIDVNELRDKFDEKSEDETKFKLWLGSLNYLTKTFGAGKFIGDFARHMAPEVTEPTIHAKERLKTIVHSENLPGATYDYRETSNIGSLKLDNGDLYEKEGNSKPSTIEEISKRLSMNPEDPEEYLNGYGFYKVKAKKFAGYTDRRRNPFPSSGKSKGKLGDNSNRRDLWDNIVSVLWDMSDNELKDVSRYLKGEPKTKKQSNIPLFE